MTQHVALSMALATSALGCGANVVVDLEPPPEAPPIEEQATYPPHCEIGAPKPIVDNIRAMTDLITVTEHVPTGALHSKALMLGLRPPSSPDTPTWSLAYLAGGELAPIAELEEPYRPEQMLASGEGVYVLATGSEALLRWVDEEGLTEVTSFTSRYPTEHRLIETSNNLYYLDGADRVNAYGYKGQWAIDDLPADAFVLHQQAIHTLEGHWRSPCDNGHCASQVGALTLHRHNPQTGERSVITDRLCAGGGSFEGMGVTERFFVLDFELIYFDGVNDFFFVDTTDGSLRPLAGLGTVLDNVHGHRLVQHGGWLYAAHIHDEEIELVRFRPADPHVERLARLEGLARIGLIAADEDRLVFSHRDDERTTIAQLSL